ATYTSSPISCLASHILHHSMPFIPCDSIIFSRLRLPPSSPLFPYTTLFRSHARRAHHDRHSLGQRHPARAHPLTAPRPRGRFGRSEEHTSELQSRENLVCRLLLEKKNIVT